MWQIKRIYEPAETSDGYRVLIDRLWPRGMTKAEAKLDEWLKDIAPSAELRRTFCHDPALFESFSKGYLRELQQGVAHQAGEHLRQIAATQTVTLLYGAKDEQFNHARVLLDYLQST